MLFDSLDLLLENEPRSAAMNMALDEALLEHWARPLLRIYQWRAPAVSFGFFEKAAPVLAAHPDREPVRRWTGGGVVPHGADITYSLVIPAGHRVAQMAAGECYCAIHRCVAAWLAAEKFHVALADGARERVSRSCFENPVAHDVVSGDCKVAGAAQRRVKRGVLHQGSIQLELPAAARERLPAFFAETLPPIALPPAIADAAGALASAKYGAREWLLRY